MKWSNVRLIFFREVTDQLRDRRMLFMVAVLPLLLYPLLGMLFLQLTQFVEAHPTKVWVVGAGQLPLDPPLLAEQDRDGDTVWRFARDYFGSEQDADLLRLTVDAATIPPEQFKQQAEEQVASGKYDAVLYFPPDFGAGLAEYREQMEAHSRRVRGEAPEEESTVEESPAEPIDTSSVPGPPPRVPQPEIFWSAAKDKSNIAQMRLGSVLANWRSAIDTETREEVRMPSVTSVPFELRTQDVTEAKGGPRTTIWVKVLPFVLMIWALTGAFHPAIDLCAGEKERGTLETLLSSPAQRSEIVWGKLCTVITFSAATALLNLLSMGVSGAIIMRKFEGAGFAGAIPLGPPPLMALGWLVLAAIPIAALFSALAMALAAMARSTKEGQYYLLPLLMVMMPLLMIPLLPASEITLGKSLIPVTGLMMLLRTLMEGRYTEALLYAVPVIAVTAICCHLAIRWAVDQFNNESVIFRESERFSLSQWVTHLVRDRTDTPSLAEGAMCGILLLVIGFMAKMTVNTQPTWNSIAVSTLVFQVAFILAPVVIMAVVLTRKPAKTLLLRVPNPLALPAALALAFCVHPVAISLTVLLKTLYPVKGLEALEAFQGLVTEAPWWQVVLVLAVLPAVCEELAFRGFILSGLRHMGHKWGAIALASLFFGLAHMMVIQQSISAFVLGLVLGFIAVQTRSIFPGMIFHVTHNSLLVSVPKLEPMLQDHFPWFYGWMVNENSPIGYSWPLVAVAGVLTIALLLWFRREPYVPTEEERLQEALDHQRVPAA